MNEKQYMAMEEAANIAAYPEHKTLLEAQLAAYPDSLVLTDDQVLHAIRNERPDWLHTHKFEDWRHYDARHEMGWWAEMYYRQWRDLQTAQAQAQWARWAFLNRADSPDGFFYACSKKADGTYRYVGFRYGLEESQYASGSEGLTYTPQGEVK